MWIKRILCAAGIVSGVTGLVMGYSVYSFVKQAQPVQATVISVEYRQGPPKFRQTTPVHVRYTNASGEQVQTVTNLPFLQSLKEGDVVTVLANPQNPQDVRWPLPSELFAVPLRYLMFGLAAVIGSFLLRFIPKSRQGVNKGGRAPVVVN
jgi:hypothetical protein